MYVVVFSGWLRQRNLILRCFIPVVLPNNKNKLNGIYVYRHKHNYILCSMFTVTKAQLHVSALNNDITYRCCGGDNVLGVNPGTIQHENAETVK